MVCFADATATKYSNWLRRTVGLICRFTAHELWMFWLNWEPDDPSRSDPTSARVLPLRSRAFVTRIRLLSIPLLGRLPT